MQHFFPSQQSFPIIASNCRLCPRLGQFRDHNKEKYPTYHNAPVPGFGSQKARLAIIGLAPGLHGANQTGRPFTGDYAGDLLYATLLTHRFANGIYQRLPDDNLQLLDCRIINAVRCVPPDNKPIGQEINQCRNFLLKELIALDQIKAILVLGTIAHQSCLRALGYPVRAFPFAHGKTYHLDDNNNLAKPLALFSSYHCSRYNVNTKRLTQDMFEQVIHAIRVHLN